MGCDIFGFVEYSSSDNGLFEIFAEGIWLQRDYTLFAALAGVRASKNIHPLYPPKGLPKRISQEGFNAIYVPVCDGVPDEVRSLTSSMTVKESEGLEIISSNHPSAQIKLNNGYALHPDTHSYSWLTLDEIIKSLDHLKLSQNSIPIDFLAMMNSMKTMEENIENCVSRFVFWFGN